MTSYRKRAKRQAAAVRRRSSNPKPEVRLALVKPAPVSDGLKVLESKGKLPKRLKEAAYAYRHDYILTASEGVPTRSCLNIEIRGGGSAGLPSIVTETEAKRRLFAFRWLACGGVEDLVGVLDEVAGRGRTLWELAQGKEREAIRLEAHLLTALKLVAQHLDKALDHSREQTDIPTNVHRCA